MSALGKNSAAGTGAFAQAERAAKFILANTKLRPRVAIVLGSGLGAFADGLAKPTVIPYAKIPHFPRSTAIGHVGQLVIGLAGNIPVAAMQGRVHFYEGYPLSQVVFPMRVLGRIGIRSAILTNAAGGVNTKYSQGALVAIRDHINLQGSNPLIGPNDDRFGPRFSDMTHAYRQSYREIAVEEEIRYLRAIGADLVGMSTAPEVIVARHMGIRVLGISCVTNMAAGILDQELNHQEVLETGERVKGQFIALLEAVLPKIAEDAAKRERE